MTKKVIITGAILTAIGLVGYIYGLASGNVHIPAFSVELTGAGLVALTIGITEMVM